MCPLADVAHRLHGGSPHIAQPGALALHITGDAHMPRLDLDDPLTDVLAWLQAGLPDTLPGAEALTRADLPATDRPRIVLLLIDGSLHIDGAMLARKERDPVDNPGEHAAPPAHLVVAGHLHARNAVLAGAHLHIHGALHIADLLWCHGDQGTLAVQGSLRARVAVFTGGHALHLAPAQEVAFLIDEVRGGPHLALDVGDRRLDALQFVLHSRPLRQVVCFDACQLLHQHGVEEGARVARFLELRDGVSDDVGPGLAARGASGIE
jgi:hypothetical protein